MSDAHKGHISPSLLAFVHRLDCSCDHLSYSYENMRTWLYSVSLLIQFWPFACECIFIVIYLSDRTHMMLYVVLWRKFIHFSLWHGFMIYNYCICVCRVFMCLQMSFDFLSYPLCITNITSQSCLLDWFLRFVLCYGEEYLETMIPLQQLEVLPWP